MTIEQLINQVEQRGVKLVPRGELLAIQPGGLLPAALKEELRLRKPEVIQVLHSRPGAGWGTIPPLNLALDHRMPKPPARQCHLVVDYLSRQTKARFTPLARWLVSREVAYHEGPGRRWDCALFSYAAARDAACWQLKRTEGELWTLLEGFQEVADSMRRPSPEEPTRDSATSHPHPGQSVS